MSDAYNPMGGGQQGGPMSRPDGNGLPPKTGGGLTRPTGEDALDPGMGEDGDLGDDTGGMAGEG